MVTLTHRNSTRNSASPLPIVFAILFLIASIVIYFVTRSTAHAPLFHTIGYLLTPIGVALCLGWDNISQRNGLKENPWFERNKTYSIILRVFTVLSFFVALPHIHSLAVDLAEKFAR